jgi:hypothetical protein
MAVPPQPLHLFLRQLISIVSGSVFDVDVVDYESIQAELPSLPPAAILSSSAVCREGTKSGESSCVVCRYHHIVISELFLCQ